MSIPSKAQANDPNQPISDFIIEKVGDLWGVQERSWGWHYHPDDDRLSAEFQELLEREFGSDEATRATAELLCYQNRPDELEWWMANHPWWEAEKRQRIGFGAWLWQANHPSAFGQDFFMKEAEWQTATPMPQIYDRGRLYLVSHVLFSWLGMVPSMLNYQVKPRLPSPNPRGLEMVEAMIQREFQLWPLSREHLYAESLIVLKTAGRLNLELVRQALNVAPGLATNHKVDASGLGQDLAEIVFEFAAELSEENSRRFCHFGWPSGGRWVIRACENVERLGLATLVSQDDYDRNDAIRKISGIHAFLPTDDLKGVQKRVVPVLADHTEVGGGMLACGAGASFG
jgi:hypothetical protein